LRLGLCPKNCGQEPQRYLFALSWFTGGSQGFPSLREERMIVSEKKFCGAVKKNYYKSNPFNSWSILRNGR